jgi:hypothetical protein
MNRSRIAARVHAGPPSLELVVSSTAIIRTLLGTPCYPDRNGDAALTVADFGCFQTKFVAGCP